MGLPADFTPANQGGGNQIYFRDIDLSVARNGVEFELPGFSFMSIATEAFDSSGGVTYSLSTGLMLVQLDDPGQTKLLAKSGSEFNVEPARKIYVTNAAQPNKMLRVYFANYPFLRQVPQFNSSPSTSSSIPIGSTFSVVTCTAAAQMMLNPAANLNGFVLRWLAAHGSTAQQLSVFAGTAAPVAFNDTSKLLLTSNRISTGVAAPVNLILPAGWGIWAFGSAVDANALACISGEML